MYVYIIINAIFSTNILTYAANNILYMYGCRISNRNAKFNAFIDDTEFIIKLCINYVKENVLL